MWKTLRNAILPASRSASKGIWAGSGSCTCCDLLWRNRGASSVISFAFFIISIYLHLANQFSLIWQMDTYWRSYWILLVCRFCAALAKLYHIRLWHQSVEACVCGDYTFGTKCFALENFCGLLSSACGHDSFKPDVARALARLACDSWLYWCHWSCGQPDAVLSWWRLHLRCHEKWRHEIVTQCGILSSRKNSEPFSDSGRSHASFRSKIEAESSWSSPLFQCNSLDSRSDSLRRSAIQLVRVEKGLPKNRTTWGCCNRQTGHGRSCIDETRSLR